MLRPKTPSSTSSTSSQDAEHQQEQQQPSLADLVEEARERQKREEQERFERQAVELYSAIRHALSRPVEKALKLTIKSFPGTSRPCLTFAYEGELFYLRLDLYRLVAGLLTYADNWRQNSVHISGDDDLLLYLDRTIEQVRSGE